MARKKNIGRSMSPEECAVRMTAFLQHKPRSRKTRAYLESLPKRSKVVVHPTEFCAPEPRRISFTPEPIRPVIVARASDGSEIAQFQRVERKDRVRPKKRVEAATRWSCRAGGRFKREWSGSEKLPRTIEETSRQRLFLFVAQDGLCALCGLPMEGRPFQFSLDHVIPRSLGGQDGFGNLVLCHGECNGRKTNDVPTGCEIVWLLSVNARLGAQPQRVWPPNLTGDNMSETVEKPRELPKALRPDRLVRLPLACRFGWHNWQYGEVDVAGGIAWTQGRTCARCGRYGEIDV